MIKPDWQDWPEEPWETPTEDSEAFVYGDAEFRAPANKAWPNGWILDCTTAPYGRALACVNAMAGIRNPGAVGEVVAAALAVPKPADGAAGTRLHAAIAALDADPEAE